MHGEKIERIVFLPYPPIANYYDHMLYKEGSLEITRVFNWTHTQTRIEVNIHTLHAHQHILRKVVQGTVSDGCLHVSLGVPYSCDRDQKISITLGKWGGDTLGEAVISVQELRKDKIKYCPLSPKNQHIIQVEVKASTPPTSRTTEGCVPSRLLISSSLSSLQRGRLQSTSSLKKKYLETEAKLTDSVAEYTATTDRISRLAESLTSIKSKLRDRSRSQSKLQKLKEEIQPNNLMFKQLVYPYLSVGKASRNLSPCLSMKSLKKDTLATQPDDDYHLFPLKSARRKH